MEYDDLKELVDAFLAETDEVIVRMESHLIELEKLAQDGVADLGGMADLLGPLHTFKGNAGMLGMTTVSRLVHALESAIKFNAQADAEVVTGLFGLVDALKGGLAAIGRGAEDAPELETWIAFLGQVAKQAGGTGDDGPDPHAKGAAADAAEPAAGAAAATGRIADQTTLRVSSDRLDQLQREVGELILSFNAVNDYLRRFVAPDLDRHTGRDLSDALDRLADRVRTVQGQTTQIRLLSLSAILRRVPRITRDAADRTGRQVQVLIDGEETEADKSVVDRLADVIVHLVRNAVDHGIEPPEVREALGKAERGTVMVRASSRGDHVRIEIEDDGRGVDLEAVRSKAISRGLVGREEAAGADADAVLRWMFSAGFSTRDEATELSGRGVGLDVVDRTVRELGGTIRMETTPGEGSRFILAVPISTAVAELLHVDVAGHVLSVPLRRIVETDRYRDGDVVRPAGVARYRWRDEMIPYVDLEPYLGKDGRAADYVLILEQSTGHLCLPVHAFFGKGQAVLHPLGDPLLNQGPYAGATVLGDGYVSMILDPDRLHRFAQQAAGGAA